MVDAYIYMDFLNQIYVVNGVIETFNSLWQAQSGGPPYTCQRTASGMLLSTPNIAGIPNTSWPIATGTLLTAWNALFSNGPCTIIMGWNSVMSSFGTGGGDGGLTFDGNTQAFTLSSREGSPPSVEFFNDSGGSVNDTNFNALPANNQVAFSYDPSGGSATYAISANGGGVISDSAGTLYDNADPFNFQTVLSPGGTQNGANIFWIVAYPTLLTLPSFSLYTGTPPPLHLSSGGRRLTSPLIGPYHQ